VDADPIDAESRRKHAGWSCAGRRAKISGAAGPGTTSVQLPRVVEKDGQIYGGLMAEENVDAAGPNVMDMFDAETDRSLVCRVCGSLVAAAGEYPKAHCDWHETPNGA
jgi:hypothetical protein